jgi:hypothetical protein
MRLCPSVCSCYILDVTVHGIGTLLSEHRRQWWSSSSSPICFWWWSHSFPPVLAREHTGSSLTGWVDVETSLAWCVLPCYHLKSHSVGGFAISFLGVLYWYVWSVWLPKSKGYKLERQWILQNDGISRYAFHKMPVTTPTQWHLNLWTLHSDSHHQGNSHLNSFVNPQREW